MSTGLSAIAVKLATLSSNARLSDLALFMTEGQVARAKKIRSVLGHLAPGVYLIGAGPYTQGVHSLMCDEIVIGRLATVLEEPLDRPVDVFVNDATTLTPREVSRVHCVIYRREGVHELVPAARSSDEEDISLASRALSNGDIISLGNSQINNFVFVDTRI